MNELEEILAISAAFDIKAETLASNLLTQAEDVRDEFTLDQIMISPIGSLRRRTSNDVAEIKKKYFDNDTAIQIQVNRKGLFDTLPKRLFLSLDEEHDSPKKRTKAITEEIKQARNFFLPFEQCTYHPRIEAERIEQKYTENFPKFVEELWGLDRFQDVLDERQTFLLCNLLPESYRAVGNWELTGLIFEAVLDKPINFGFKAPLTLNGEFKDSSANLMILGQESVLGDNFKDEFPTLVITVKGITNSDLPDFLEGGKKIKILDELLCAYFIPIDVPYLIEISLTDDSMDFNIGEAVLGYNMVFN